MTKQLFGNTYTPQNTQPGNISTHSTVQNDMQPEPSELINMLDQIRDCIFICRSDNLRFIYVNQGAMEQVGYTKAELLEMTPADIKPEFSIERYRQSIKPLLDNTHSTLTFETIHRHKNGDVIPVEITIQLLQNEGEIRYLVAVARDITAHAQRNKVLQERVKEIACLYSVRRGMDPGLKTDAVCQLVFKHLTEAMQFPEITIIVIELNDKRFTSGKYSQNLVHGLNADIMINGNAYGQLRVFYCEDRPFLLPEEQNLIDSVALDMQWWLERKQAAQELKSSLTQQTKRIQSALDEHAIVVMTNTHGIMTYVNDKFCAISKYAREELLGQNHRIINSGHHSTAFFRELWETIGSGRVWKGELKNRAKDGALYWVHATIVPFLDEHGAPVQYISMRTDITKHKQAEQALINAKTEAVKANRAKDSFLATMSHEIRTPLGALLGMLELLNYTPLSNDQAETLQAAQNSADSLLRILNDILDWSKIEAKKLELAPQATSISQLVTEVVNTYARAASAKSLVLWQHIDVRLSPAHMIDPLRLSQVLKNFVSNALKFTPKGQIEIQVVLLRRDNNSEQIRFSVKDTGIGIAEDVQRRLFQDYNQYSGDTARLYGGTGLGLAISRRLTNLLGGQIKLESTPHEGSTFSITLTLPIATVAEEPAPDQHMKKMRDITLSAPYLAPGVAPVILVVDDHPINRKLLAAQLKLFGLSCKQTNNGEEALAQWRNGGFSLIITDCHMPTMDGYRLTQAIRQIERSEARPSTPIIGWTANALPQEAKHCEVAGMNALLVKPSRLMQLKAMLQQWLPATTLAAAGTFSARHKKSSNTHALINIAGMAKVSLNAADELNIFQDFIAQTRSDFIELEEALKQQDFAACARTAHRIKGASRMVEAGELAAACETMEVAARQNDSKSLSVANITLNQALERLEAGISEQVTASERIQ